MIPAARSSLLLTGIVMTLAIMTLAMTAAAQDSRGIKVATRHSKGNLSSEVDGNHYDFGTYYALLIYVRDYHKPFPKLKTPQEDVRRLKSVLTHHYGFTHVTELGDHRATRRGILRAIAAYRGLLGKRDNLLIYYAGHGQKDRFDNYYWIPYDGTSDFTTWVPATEVRALLRSIDSRHTLLVSDSCFAGGLMRAGLRTKQVQAKAMRRLHQKQSAYVLASGGVEQVADHGKDGCSLFAYHLTQRLQTHPASYLTVGELAHMVMSDVAGDLQSTQAPEFAPIPGVVHDGGQFVFVRTAQPSDEFSRTIAPEIPGVPKGWVLPAGVIRTQDGRFFSKVQGRDRTEMVMVWGSRFLPHGSDEVVKMEPFLIDKFEVSNERFKRFLVENEHVMKTLKNFNQKGHDHPQQPVTFVTMRHARQFAEWAGKRLPNEHQWELAACWDHEKNRRRRYPWGARFADAGFERRMSPPRIVEFGKDLSPHGVRGMGGGVREWCELVQRDATNAVVRGGTHYIQSRRHRLDQDPTYRRRCKTPMAFANVGFRCVIQLIRP